MPEPAKGDRPRTARVVFFWRGARRNDRRWWQPLWKKPPEAPPATARKVAWFFSIGIAAAALAYVARAAIRALR
jgi:hypothetical protein